MSLYIWGNRFKYEKSLEADLTSVNDQIVKLVDELNKINSAREQLIQQVQNLNGVAMYLRGKEDSTPADAPLQKPD